jgi:hypothetical protein
MGFRPGAPAVVVGLLDHHGVHRGLKAVAVRGAAGVQAQRRHGHHVGAVQRHEAVRRAHEVHAGPAGLEVLAAAGVQLVLHDLGDGELGQRFGQRGLQARGQRGPGHLHVQEQRRGLAVRRLAQQRQGVGADAHRGQLLQQRGRGRTVGGQADGHRHQLDGLRRLGRHGQDVADVRAQPARGSEHGQRRGLAGQAGAAQALQQRGAERLAELLQRLGRQLFDEEFDEQVLGVAHAQAAFFASWAATSSAQAFGASGKPMRARLSR